MSRAGENVTGGQQTVEKRPKTFHEQKLKPRRTETNESVVELTSRLENKLALLFKQTHLPIDHKWDRIK